MNFLNDECCLCYQLNLAEIGIDGQINCILMTCCGKLFCKSYRDKYDKSHKESGKELTCPMCRTLYPKSRKENFERLLPKAREGKSWAEETLGRCYYYGDGVTQNYKKAFRFISRAAAQGEACALNCVGKMYQSGQGVDQSYDQAFLFYSQAAELGLAEGQYNVGYCYANGWGVEKSMEGAVEWYSRAADDEKGGHPFAQNNLALCYQNGVGVEKNNKRALNYFSLAAEKNCKEAHVNLYLIYNKGGIVSKSYPLAIYWLKQFLKDNEDEKQCAEAKEQIESLLFKASEICAFCKKKRGGDVKFTLSCSRCLSAWYCNSECQTTHWKKEGGHKKECKAPKIIKRHRLIKCLILMETHI